MRRAGTELRGHDVPYRWVSVRSWSLLEHAPRRRPDRGVATRRSIGHARAIRGPSMSAGEARPRCPQALNESGVLWMGDESILDVHMDWL